MNSMTEQERWEFELELREEARREALEEASFQYAMTTDQDFAYSYITEHLSNEFVKEFKDMVKTCNHYDLEWKEALSCLL